jgi:hypothetical protein
VELKARRAADKWGRRVDSKSFMTWLVPCCKVEAFQYAAPRRGVVFYWFEGDNSLWVVWDDEIDWTSIEEGIPVYSEQLHYFVPAGLWKKVE